MYSVPWRLFAPAYHQIQNRIILLQCKILLSLPITHYLTSRLNHRTMDLSRFSFIAIIISFVFFSSCRKGHSPTPVPVILDSILINLNFPQSQSHGPTDTSIKYELIVSEAVGKVLLDTLLPYNTSIVQWLKTYEKLLDVTIVQKPATTNNYLVHSYKAIDLPAWENVPDNDSVQLPSGIISSPPVSGIIVYRNVNAPYGTYFNLLDYGSGQTGFVNDIVAYGDFNAPIGDYAYLMFPTLGLYNLHRIESTRDTVYLSNPDTLTTVHFYIPSAYTSSGFSIAGYPDSNDLAHNMNLTYFTGFGTPFPSPDGSVLLYPGKKGFKKYTFDLYASNPNTSTFAGVNLPFVDTVPANLQMPEPNWYNISSVGNTSVNVDFKNHKPTYYDITSRVGDIQFTLTLPGDSTTPKPLNFYADLKSKLLTSQNLNTMQLNTITIVTNAETDYQAYWLKHTKIYQAWKEPELPSSNFQTHF